MGTNRFGISKTWQLSISNKTNISTNTCLGVTWYNGNTIKLQKVFYIVQWLLGTICTTVHSVILIGGDSRDFQSITCRTNQCSTWSIHKDWPGVTSEHYRTKQNDALTWASINVNVFSCAEHILANDHKINQRGNSNITTKCMIDITANRGWPKWSGFFELCS